MLNVPDRLHTIFLYVSLAFVQTFIDIQLRDNLHTHLSAEFTFGILILKSVVVYDLTSEENCAERWACTL